MFWVRVSIGDSERAAVSPRHLLRPSLKEPVGFLKGCRRFAKAGAATAECSMASQCRAALRGVAGLLGLLTCGAALATAPAADDAFQAALEQHDVRSGDPEHAGIWKAATPPAGSMHGEFAGNDPLGLSAGAKIPADCSINWTDPDSGKLYCFSSATSLVVFLDAPHAYLRRAAQNWHGS
jgi:hypothetical protein